MKKILIIDDDEDIVDIVHDILVSKGFDTYTYSNGFNVPALVRDHNPNLILLDIKLYGQSGADICKELKRKHDMPIILFSADTRLGKAYADCNADGFLEKPFNVKDLLGVVTHHLAASNAVA